MSIWETLSYFAIGAFLALSLILNVSNAIRIRELEREAERLRWIERSEARK